MSVCHACVSQMLLQSIWCTTFDCSVLRYVAECIAECCSVLQCAAMQCSVLQCVAVCCSVWQWVAVCCSVLQCLVVWCSLLSMWCITVLHHGWCTSCLVCCNVLQCVAVCCSVVQCVPCAAVCCSLLLHCAHCAAVRCSALQCAAVCSITDVHYLIPDPILWFVISSRPVVLFFSFVVACCRVCRPSTHGESASHAKTCLLVCMFVCLLAWGCCNLQPIRTHLSPSATKAVAADSPPNKNIYASVYQN